jgi:hypothetical protein
MIVKGAVEYKEGYIVVIVNGSKNLMQINRK